MLKGTCYGINISTLVINSTTTKQNMFQVNSKNTVCELIKISNLC